MSVAPSFRHPTQKGGEGARAERNMAVGFKAVELVGFYLVKWFLQILHPYCPGAGALHCGVGEARWKGPHPDLLGKRQHNLSRLWRGRCFVLGHPMSFSRKVVIVAAIFNVTIFTIIRALGASPGFLDLLLTGLGSVLFTIIGALAALYEKGDGNQVMDEKIGLICINLNQCLDCGYLDFYSFIFTFRLWRWGRSSCGR